MMIRLSGPPTAARRLDELPLLERQEGGAHEPRGRHPVQDADDRHDQQEDAELRAERARAACRGTDRDHQQQRQDRQRQEHVGEPHERVVEPAPKKPAIAPTNVPTDRDEHGDEPDRERDPAAPQHAGQHVAAEVVRAERVRRDGPCSDSVKSMAFDRRARDERADEGEDDQEDERHEPAIASWWRRNWTRRPSTASAPAGAARRRPARRVSRSSVAATMSTDPRIEDAVQHVGDQLNRTTSTAKTRGSP